MQERWREYFRFLDQLGRTLDQLAELAKEKTAAARRDDLLAVEACMKKEQALGLTLRGMDRKREQMLDGLGLRNVKLSALSRSCPRELQGEARAAAETLHDRYMLYRSAADVARDTLECNLHQIEKIIGSGADALENGAHAADFRV